MLVGFADVAITSVPDLHRALDRRAIGRTTSLHVLRDGGRDALAVTPEEMQAARG